MIYAALAVRSAGAGIQTPAVSAMIPQIVPPGELLRINGIFGSVQSAMTLGAPVLAAGLYAQWGLESTLFLDVITAVIGIVLLSRIPLRKVVRSDAAAADGTRVGIFADLKEGLVYVWQHRTLRFVIGYFTLVLFLAVPPSFLTPLLIARSFGDAVWYLTANEIAFGLGMVAAGALVAIFATRFTNRFTLIALAATLLGVLSVGLGVVPWFWAFLVLMMLTGFAVPFFSMPLFTIVQEQVDAEKQGRVFGIITIVMAVAMPVGMGLIGPIADRWSVELMLIIGGALTVVAGVWGLSRAGQLGAAVTAGPTTEAEAP